MTLALDNKYNRQGARYDDRPNFHRPPHDNRPPRTGHVQCWKCKGLATALWTVNSLQHLPIMHVLTCWKPIPAIMLTTTLELMTTLQRQGKLRDMLLVGAMGPCGERPETEQHSHPKPFRLPGMHEQTVAIQQPVAVALDPHLHLPPGQAHLPQGHPSPARDLMHHRHHRWRLVTLSAVSTPKVPLISWRT